MARRAMAAMVAQGIDGIEQSPNDENDAIITYSMSADFGYLLTMIHNGDASSTYQLSMNYPKFEGMELLSPESGDGYQVSVKAGETRTILIKQDCKGYSYASSFSSQVLMSYDNLIEKCLEEGTQNDRADGIYQKYLSHSGGIIYVYKNETGDKTLKEELGLNLEGLRVDGQEDQSKVDILIVPGQRKVIKLVTTGGGYSIGTSCSYNIT